MSADVQPKSAKRIPWMRRLGSYVIVLVIGVLLGFVPTWLTYRQCPGNLAAAERQLNPVKIENALATAVISVQRDDYKAALQAASDFYTLLRAETDKGDVSALSPAQREGVQSLFVQQDTIITLLARSDPASQEQLVTLYASYRETMSK
jgi:hypothetical protein